MVLLAERRSGSRICETGQVCCSIDAAAEAAEAAAIGRAEAALRRGPEQGTKREEAGGNRGGQS